MIKCSGDKCLFSVDSSRRIGPQVLTKKVLFLLSSLEYLKEVAGPRTVPVEMGSRYTDEEWSQKLMTIAEFIDEYILSQVHVDICLLKDVCYAATVYWVTAGIIVNMTSSL